MIVGVSPAIRRALALAERYAGTRLPILLVGPTGTGKEVFAQHVHERSGRPGRFEDVNCCALPREMVESLLFGHSRGAFTGAIYSAAGHLERSDGGTLFLDELSSLAPEAQGKLLRALETGEVQPLGRTAKLRIDLRVIAAAQEDLGADLEAGRFRRDLYQRIAGVVIELPALAARPEDILPLAQHFALQGGRHLAPRCERVLLSYLWPGNVRELQLAIERAGELADNGSLSPTALTEAIALGTVRSRDGASAQAALLTVCRAHAWHGAEIARALGIGRTTLHARLREAGLSLRRGRKTDVVRLCSAQT